MKYLPLAKSLSGLLLFFTITSCTIYRSPERKEFESEAPGFLVKNLKLVGCSYTSLKEKANSSKLLTVIQAANSENQFLWEYIISSESYFESDNLNGVYCEFEKS